MCRPWPCDGVELAQPLKIQGCSLPRWIYGCSCWQPPQRILSQCFPLVQELFFFMSSQAVVLPGILDAVVATSLAVPVRNILRKVMKTAMMLRFIKQLFYALLIGSLIVCLDLFGFSWVSLADAALGACWMVPILCQHGCWTGDSVPQLASTRKLIELEWSLTCQKHRENCLV